MPDDTGVTIRGLDELTAKLARIGRSLSAELHTVTNRAVLYVHSQVPPYPPAPDGSTYTRTGTLGREITTEVRDIGSQVVGVIGTATVYAPWVISEEAAGGRGPQARVHQGRWWTLQGVVRKAMDAVLGIYRDWVRGLIR